MENLKIIQKLIKLSQKAVKKDESPVAALIVYKNKIIAKAYNKRNKSKKTTDHAEIIAIKKANAKIKNWRLNNCSLYVTIEPCEMCKSVIKESRIEKVYYLLSKNEQKHQYNKTIFNELKNENKEVLREIESYKNIISEFWKNKR